MNSDAAGIIYGDVSSTRFQMAVSDPGLRRLDYVQTDHDEGAILGQVEVVHRLSDMTYDQALALSRGGADGQAKKDRLSAEVHVLGRVDDRGRVHVPRTPFRAGATVERAREDLVTSVLGLTHDDRRGAYIGHVKGLRIPVNLSLNMLAQKHLSVLAKTGAGKSYTVGVILEEFLQAEVPLLILDPHGEYGALRHPNVDPDELKAMVRYKVRPKSFQSGIKEFAIDTGLNPEADRLHLDGVNLEAREILDLLGGKLSSGQVGVLYQAVKEVKEDMPGYTLKDVMDAVARNKSSARWNVLNALEALEATGLFHTRATPMEELLRPGQCTIINLKGVAPDQQEIVATRLIGRLWEARKRGDAPPHILVVEEAHNFCPERGAGQAHSGAVIRTVASEGRKFGMGLVIVSQRPAKIDKNVLSQCNTQLVLKITNPNDLKAISQSVEGITAETTEELQRLPVGSALVSGGGLTQPVFVDIRPRLTRHGGRSIEILSQEEDPDEDLEGTVAAAPEASADGPDAAPYDEESPFATIFEDEEPATAEATPLPQDDAATWDLEHPEARADTPADKAEAPAADAAAPILDRDVSPLSGQAPEDPAPAAEDLETHPEDAPAPASEPPKQWKRRELEAIGRVVDRIGLLQEQDTGRIAPILQDLAVRQGRHQDHYLRFYHRIATTACRQDTPRCVSCPLSERCSYHARLRAERHKGGGIIRRLWNRT